MLIYYLYLGLFIYIYVIDILNLLSNIVYNLNLESSILINEELTVDKNKYKQTPNKNKVNNVE